MSHCKDYKQNEAQKRFFDNIGKSLEPEKEKFLNDRITRINKDVKVKLEMLRRKEIFPDKIIPEIEKSMKYYKKKKA